MNGKEMARRLDKLERAVAEIQGTKGDLVKKAFDYLVTAALGTAFDREELGELRNQLRLSPTGSLSLRDLLPPQQLEKFEAAIGQLIQKHTGIAPKTFWALPNEQRTRLLLKSKEIRNDIQSPEIFQTPLAKKFHGYTLAKRNQW